MVPTSPIDYLSFVAVALAFFFALHCWTLRMNRRVPLPREGWGVLTVLLIAGWFWVDWFGWREQRNMQQALEGYAPVYAQALELLGHSTLPRENPASSPTYVALIEAEKRWLEANRTLADVYTCRRLEDGQVVFVVDSETDYDRDGRLEGDREERTPAGEPWRTEIGPEMEAAFRGQLGFGQKTYEDRWGRWISAFYPLRNPAGNVEAVLGLDFDAAVWEGAVRRGRLAALGYLGATVLALAGLSAETARHRRRNLRQINEAERLKRDAELLQARVAEQTRELRQANVELKAEVARRQRAQAEVEAMHRQMVDASRRAGMADVATSVLHNVGNVLNSVSVSASLIYSQLQRPILAKLQRLVDLLEQQRGDLPGFLQTERGRAVLPFLRDASKHLDEERKMVTGEAARLQRHIEHIKQIVTSQQSFARFGGVEEEVQVEELLQDALNLNATTFENSRIKVVQAINARPTLIVDRHKVLTILVNLLRNAKHALLAHERTDKRLIFRAAPVGTDHVRIDIEDNGIGIAPEHLEEIFRLGFTTKKDGHGFGLHSCAVTAQELGGTLRAQSPGIGLGATFTLCLPVCRSAERRSLAPGFLLPSQNVPVVSSSSPERIEIAFDSDVEIGVTADK